MQRVVLQKLQKLTSMNVLCCHAVDHSQQKLEQRAKLLDFVQDEHQTEARLAQILFLQSRH